jgi:inositol transport system substrate-binding protein
MILGGLDGDSTACKLIKDGIVDATGVQNLNFEADAIVKAVATAIEKGEGKPKQAIDDPGFALTADNLEEREKDMWGCTIAPPS